MLKWIKKRFFPISGTESFLQVQNISSQSELKFEEYARFKAQGNQFFKDGKLKDAETSYLQAITLQDHEADVHNKLGDVYYELRQLSQAEKYYRLALTIKPDFLDAGVNLGICLDEQSRFAEAEVLYTDLLKIHPDSYLLCFNLGVTLTSLARTDDAVLSYKKALQFKPDFAHAHFNLANILQRTGRLDQAEFHYKQSIAAVPNHFSALCNLGVIYKDRGQLDEAENYFYQALRINLNHAETQNNLGLVLNGNNKLDAAINCFRKAMEIKPDFADAHCNLGDTYMKKGRVADAEQCYQTAISLNQKVAGYHGNLGALYHETGRYLKASASYQRSFDLEPNSLNLFVNMGHVYVDRGMHEEAEQCYRKALEIKPDRAQTYGDLLFLMNYDSDRSAEEIFAQYQAYDEVITKQYQQTWQTFSNDRDPDRRLKVGFVSPDFRQHAVRYFLEPLLAKYDSKSFEVYAYAELKVEDAVSARYKAYVDHWIPTSGMSNEDMADRIRLDGIDILIDLAGHTGGNRLQVFARKPAPIQVSWLGFGYTTGLSAIDYFLTDGVCAPSGSETLFAEKLWRIDAPPFVYRPADDMGEVNPLPALKNGYITLGSLTRAVRINHHTVRVWSAILTRIDNAKLLINSVNFQDIDSQRELEDKFAAYGIDRTRLKIGYNTPPWDTLRTIDIGLDCFPHNSGTTLFESLYMGIPIVTLAGRPSVGLLGSSILRGLRRDEWIAHTEEQYVDKVVSLAGDINQLSFIRANLREEMKHSTLMDEAGFSAKLELAFRAMWTKWCDEHAEL